MSRWNKIDRAMEVDLDDKSFRAVVATSHKSNVLCRSRAELRIVTRELAERGQPYFIEYQQLGE